ncbi:hypothetical protein [Saccharopolyspora erythraea]|uniref:Uncharacterized protein n=2 Tax=Saccharopolyspora erythraea TaxID=1836 RepID=A4FMY1_SACEN|nr:hypothetical protein [Saccharopolyspora erythraea]QRK89013.1 hypothetical protein JQX30_31220 [Saccharopolyspora erythraea]CAM05406.1 hypothetical protein SACE_6233 [Saccharopolyspora erythraea NRRL 2338]
MGFVGALFPGRKLRHEGDQGAPGREHDPGGPLDLDRGVVFLAPPNQDAAQPSEQASTGAEEDDVAADTRDDSGEDGPVPD